MGKVPMIQENRFERPTGPAQLVLSPEDREWVRACRQYRRDLMAGLIEKDHERGGFVGGPKPEDFRPGENDEPRS